MEISLHELTQALSANAPHETTMIKVGVKYFFRTVTNYFTGRVEEVVGREVRLSDAAWIADTKRFGDMLSDGLSSDAIVEPFPSALTPVINLDTCVDYCQWPHGLPRKQQ